MDHISQQSQAPFNNLFLQENRAFKSWDWKCFSLVKQKQGEETLAVSFLHAAFSPSNLLISKDISIYTLYLSKNTLTHKTHGFLLSLPRGSQEDWAPLQWVMAGCCHLGRLMTLRALLSPICRQERGMQALQAWSNIHGARSTPTVCACTFRN